MIKIGIIKEGKHPIDRRVPLTPQQAKQLQSEFDVEVFVQSSDIRCFKDEEYESLGLQIVEDLESCDIILGVKEVPIDWLIPHKTYFFFSHTIKKQDYNKDLFKTILDKKIRLIDYEVLTNERGERLIAFGRWAGIVGAYNGIKTYGERYNFFHLKPAHECFDLEELMNQLREIKLPSIKIIITGGGRVAKGSMEVMHALNVRKVNAERFLNEDFDEAVFVQLNSRDYNKHKNGLEFKRSEFFEHPENFERDFLKYTKVSDVLIAAAFWHPDSPVLFKREEILRGDFQLRVIADITCDIEGSIPSTLQASTIDDPVYDYNPSEHRVENPYIDEANLSVMAVDNLPCELPRDSSQDFGKQLLSRIIPALLGSDEEKIIKRATIARDGEVTDNFKYLSEWVEK
ncbi:MAG: NAD(P)-dependent oxidoreductase [Bacteroidota bacterium]